MINIPTDTSKLSPEQTAQLAEFYPKLSNLESELAILTKNVRATKLESERSVKDKAYQEELLVGVTVQVEAKKSELTILHQTNNEIKEILAKLNSEISEKSSKITAKEMELKNREAEVEKGEKEVETKQNALNSAITTLSRDKSEHQEKVSRLKEVISTL